MPWLAFASTRLHFRIIAFFTRALAALLARRGFAIRSTVLLEIGGTCGRGGFLLGHSLFSSVKMDAASLNPSGK